MTNTHRTAWTTSIIKCNSACRWSTTLHHTGNAYYCDQTRPRKFPIVQAINVLEFILTHETNTDHSYQVRQRKVSSCRSSFDIICELNNCNTDEIGDRVTKIFSEKYFLWQQIPKCYKNSAEESEDYTDSFNEFGFDLLSEVFTSDSSRDDRMPSATISATIETTDTVKNLTLSNPITENIGETSRTSSSSFIIYHYKRFLYACVVSTTFIVSFSF